MIAACAPLVQDVVVTGHDRDESASSSSPTRPAAAALRRPTRRPGRADRRARGARPSGAGLAAHNAATPAQLPRIARALLLAEPPSIDAGEITDKGYVNQRAVLLTAGRRSSSGFMARRTPKRS